MTHQAVDDPRQLFLLCDFGHGFDESRVGDEINIHQAYASRAQGAPHGEVNCRHLDQQMVQMATAERGDKKDNSDSKLPRRWISRGCVGLRLGQFAFALEHLVPILLLD